jgi:hypothetical protein
MRCSGSAKPYALIVMMWVWLFRQSMAGTRGSRWVVPPHDRQNPVDSRPSSVRQNFARNVSDGIAQVQSHEGGHPFAYASGTIAADDC